MSGIKKDFIVRRTITEVEGKPVVTTYSEEELVRCGDCEWWDKREYECKNDDVLRRIKDCGCGSTFRTERDWFCADGIRRISE